MCLRHPADGVRDAPLAAGAQWIPASWVALRGGVYEPAVDPGLLSLDNVVLLPHVGSATRRTREQMAMLAARNVHAVLSGGDPLTPVTAGG